MFTGIIKELGKVKKIINKYKNAEIEIISNKLIKSMDIGDSISVNGCCLTVKSYTDSSFKCDISFATLNTTTFKYIKPGQIVNLEDSLTPKDKLGGHFVSGHVDTTGKILKISKAGDSYKFYIELLPQILPYIALKGSIAVEGISLTVAELKDDCFGLVIIPHTFYNTNLKFKMVGDFVNIEVDLISRYIAHILKYYNYVDSNYLHHEEINKTKKNILPRLNDKQLKEKLTKYGFIK